MTPEMKSMHGILEANDDGFTYVAGRHKQGRVKRTRNKQQTARCMRNDKRSVKQAENRRMLKEQDF
jgi:hypothetical protein